MYSEQLKSFICVADCGSFSKAAEKLFVSSTAVMKQMNMLEKELGIKLFIRTNHGIRLPLRVNQFIRMQNILFPILKRPFKERYSSKAPRNIQYAWARQCLIPARRSWIYGTG